MSPDAVPGWTPSPWFLVTPPVVPGTAVDRPLTSSTIGRVVTGHRLTEVTAPPGYGKTVAMSQWAASGPVAVAWLTLTRFDTDPSRIARGVFSSLWALARRCADPRARHLLRPGADLGDVAAGYDALCAAFDALADPVALVVDDAQMAGPALARSLVGALVEHGMPKLHLVLVSTERTDLPLAGPRLRGAVARLGPRELAFTEAEVAAAGARMGVELPHRELESIVAATAGWPAAVRLALLARSRSGSPEGGQDVGPGPTSAAPPPTEASLLADYIADEVLDQLRPELVDFVLSVTTCSRFDATLAAELSGRSDSAALLDECVRRALFLDRFDVPGHRPVYRWHDVFADACRALLRRTDPDRADQLDRVAARRLADRFALEAVVHALRSGDPGLATEIVTSSWIGLIIRAHGGALDRLCGQLDPPFGTDPAVLAIRAACRDADGDRVGASLLLGRASAHLDPPGPASTGGPGPSTAGRPDVPEVVAAVRDFTVASARLFVANDEAVLAQAVDEVVGLLEGTRALPPRTYASGLFLVGWTEMRLRRDPARSIELLRAAVQECDAVGEHDVADRARSNLSFALALAGCFDEVGALHPARRPDPEGSGSREDQAPPPYDGGVEPMATGFVAFWRDDLDIAAEALRLAVEADDGEATYAALARVYLAFVACASGDPASMRDAEEGLARVSDTTQHGVPWPLYKAMARMKLAEARGQQDEALALARSVDEHGFVPISVAMAAEVLRRFGECDRAEGVLDAIAPTAVAPYLRASILVTRALVAFQRDDPRAHRLFEEGLDAAVPESVVRPFADDDPTLRRLLVAHATWGTRHEGFVAARIAQGQATVSRHQLLGEVLSSREHEVLSLMRTTMTASDIAAALFVSINTVKTHQRAIYRKLGVNSRRDAIRVAPWSPGRPG